MRKSLQVDFKAQESNGAGELLFTGEDLSEGGTFLRSDLLLEQGESLALVFTVPGSTSPVKTQARVAWVRRFPGPDEVGGMGIEFIGMTAEDRRTLMLFLESDSN